MTALAQAIRAGNKLLADNGDSAFTNTGVSLFWQPAQYPDWQMRFFGVGANRVFASFTHSVRGYGLTANRGNICGQVPHSHSIVSGTHKRLKLSVFS
jgi:hypothetical protein